MKIIHDDIKPETLSFHIGQVVLVDFGMSMHVKDQTVSD